MPDSKVCPFCGNNPHVGVAYGIKYAACETVGCAMNGKCVPVKRWNNRAEIAEEKILQSASPTSNQSKSISLQRAEQSYKCAVCGCSEFDLK